MSSKNVADALREVRIKAIAFFSLVGIQTCIGITYKLATVGKKGFAFSTTSAVTMSEFAKLLLAFSFLLVDHWRKQGEQRVDGNFGFVQQALGTIREQLELMAVLNILVLSLMYAVNNQLTFFIIIEADPGSVFLFKAGSTMIVALTQRILLGRKLHRIQWSSLLLQFAGIVVVQYDPIKGAPILSGRTYVCIFISIFITALTTVRNEYLVKNYKIDLNVQNFVLYAGGALMNLFAFFFLPNPNSTHANIGLFEGYDSWAARGVVLSNAVIGIAITLVYKYADALVKMIATDCTTMILMIFSTTFLGTRSTLLTWFGVGIVFVAIQQYGDAGKMYAEEQARMKAEAEKVVASSSESETKFLEDPEGAEEDDALLQKSAPANNKVAPIVGGDRPNAATYGKPTV